MADRFFFLGVTTGRSQIMTLFPVWMGLLGLDATIEGRDLPLDGEPEVYRRAVEEIRGDPAVRGALVTTHKVAVIRHAADLFDELDRWARLLGEVSSISKRDGALVGHAKDPISSGLALEAIIGRTYWSQHPGAGVLCLGAGGSGAATAAYLLTQPVRPARIVMTNRRPGRLEAVRHIARELGAPDIVEYHAVGSVTETDSLLGSMAPGSLVINATGLGKDRPGSPISDGARFPDGAIAWDFNYRGDLRFLEQARRQLPTASVHDGWVYFVHGWTQVIAEVFGIDLTAERFSALEEAARRSREASDPPGGGPGRS
jgi:shikimate 5-dehydrogenase